MPDVEVKLGDELRHRRYRQAAFLLGKWAKEDPAYDERVGAALEGELPQATMECEEQDETSP